MSTVAEKPAPKTRPARAAKPDEVFVAYRRPMVPGGGPASQAALAEVDALLDAIAREAVGRK